MEQCYPTNIIKVKQLTKHLVCFAGDYNYSKIFIFEYLMRKINY